MASGNNKSNGTKWVAKSFAHLTATTVVFIPLLGFHLTKQSAGILVQGLQNTTLNSDIMFELALLYGLSACVWALMYIIASLVQSRRRQARVMKLKRARGTVITETLIVLPVFLLLLSGLMQLSMNSVAGLLTTLATYEVTRSMRVWAVEEDNSRSPGGTPNAFTIRDKAKVVAAGVIAPVTPEGQMPNCNLSGTSAFQFMASLGASDLNLNANANTVDHIWAYSEAWGQSQFADRAPTKFSRAYCASDVTWTNVNTDPYNNGRRNFTVTLSYMHPASFPLVGMIFVTPHSRANPWATPWVAEYRKSHTMITELTPNECHPPRDSVGVLGSNPEDCTW